MSAAAPLPPPPSSGPLGASSNGTAQPASNASIGERVFAHIQDLQARASTGYNIASPLKTLIDTAELGAAQAQTLLTYRRPDLAFVEFTRAFELATQVIPRHREYIDLIHDDKNGEQRLKVLNRKLYASYDQFMGIKGIIEKNNQRNGVTYDGARQGQVEHREQEDDRSSPSAIHTDRSFANGSLATSRQKPAPSPKPDALHGRTLPTISTASNGQFPADRTGNLADRFSRLRMNAGPLDTTHSDPRISNSSAQISPISIPSAQAFNGNDSVDILKSNSRLNGPRAAPNGTPAPARPAKLPLDTRNIAGLPKPPSPTYSPARNMETNGTIAPPRHSARSLAGSDVRRPSGSMSWSSASSRAPNGPGDSGEGYFPSSATNGAILGSAAPRRKPSYNSNDLRISAERLYDHLSRFSVLLIDVRPREDFDLGHVFTRNIMCIEPMTIRPGMSAEQLLETLVISPEAEQSMWEDRNLFDLVVYYDQDTQSESYLTRPSNDREARLKYLHEALYEYNQERPLKAAPMLLAGGLDAWCDMVGLQSLAVSNTLNRGKGQQKAAPLQRRPLATASGRSELRVPKRRLRDYNPLDQEEERSWMERARQESVSAPKPPILHEEDNEEPTIPEQEEGEGTTTAAIEDFLHRFPDAGMIDPQHSFMSSRIPARGPPPPPPAKIPEYPPPPPASSHPQRPAPAMPRMSYNGVSDRAGTQMSRASASLAPYIPPKYMVGNLRVPRTGLVNFGVTCYMNATLQALSGTTPLSRFFMEDAFRKDIQRENWKGSKGVLPELYSNVVRSLWQGDVDMIRPTTFRNFCGRLNKEWSIDRQQDAKEFFDFLVDCLHEDLNSKWSATPFKALTEAEEKRRESMPKAVVSQIEWDRYTHREDSPLTSLFGGQHASRLRCTTCGFTSTTYEAFYSVSVEIPRPRSNSGIVTLDECLQSYCAEEMLSGDEVWKCPHCRREREATKQITVTRAPQFLVVHFKRFAAGHSTSARKVRTPIDFPLQGLDLGPYMLPQPTPDQASQIAKQFDPQHLRLELSTKPPFVYDAYAVMRHIGTTLTSGHYTCAVKDRARGVWRMFNDTRVTDFQPEQLSRNAALNNEEAYIVFYQRRV